MNNLSDMIAEQLFDVMKQGDILPQNQRIEYVWSICLYMVANMVARVAEMEDNEQALKLFRDALGDMMSDLPKLCKKAAQKEEEIKGILKASKRA